MSQLAKSIKNRLPESCIVRACKKHGCSLNLKDAPTERVIVDFDKPGSPFGDSDTCCDYLLVADDGRGWVVPLEFTKGNKTETSAIRQLQAGADLADRYLPPKGDLNFRPIVVGKLKKKAARGRGQLRKRPVIFRNSKEVFVRIRSAALLSDALKT